MLTSVKFSSCIDAFITTRCPLSFFLAFILKSVLSDMNIVTRAFLSFLFAWNIFFYPFSFSLCVCFALKRASYRQHIVGSYFFNPTCHSMCFGWSIQSIDIYGNYWSIHIYYHFESCFPIHFIFLPCHFLFFLLWFDDFLIICVLSHSVVSDIFATPWTVARQAPLSMGLSRQEYWSG